MSWSYDFLKVQGVDNVNVYYNELTQGCHPTYTEVADNIKIPNTTPWIPAYAIFIDSNNEKIYFGFANFYVEGADEYYQIPLPSSYDSAYLVTIDRGTDTPYSTKLIYRLWKFTVNLSNGQIIDWTSDLEYKGTYPSIAIYDIETGNWYEIPLFIAPLIAAIIIAAITGGSAVGVAYFWQRGKHYEAKKAEYEYKASMSSVEGAKVMADTIKYITDKAEECPQNNPPDYCIKMYGGLLQGVGKMTSTYVATAGNDIKGADKDEDDSSPFDWIKSHVKDIIGLGSIIGLLFILVKFNIFQTIIDAIRDTFRRR